MNISLTKQLQKFVQDKVKSGLYGSASEVIRDALRQFGEREQQLKELRREIEIGLKQMERGEVEELDMNKIIAEAKTLHAKRRHS